jgi:hypothetical protein
MNYRTSKEIFRFAGFFWTLAVLAAFLSQCSEKTKNKQTGPYSECVVADRAELEDLQIFPVDNPLNSDISEMPKDSRSDAIIALIGAPPVHPDFGSGLWDGAPIGIPYILVCTGQSYIPVAFRANSYDGNYGDESDPGPYPIPLSAPVEGNGEGDSHVLAVDMDNRILYELYNANAGDDLWEASSGAVWDLKINDTRPEGYTSADAAGLPILPLLVRYEEIEKGMIDHAIRFTLGKSKVSRAYTSPASHLVSGTNTDESAPVPMGIRIRLKKDYDISGFSASNQVILAAMKKYGLILTDIGGDMYITGAPDERWDNEDLNQLKNVKAGDFEVVQMGDIRQ